jgi:hypothetical protein
MRSRIVVLKTIIKRIGNKAIFVSGMLLISSIFPVFTSCDIEKRMAVDYLQQRKSTAILLMGTTYLYKINKNSDSIPEFKKLTAYQKDSALFANSRFLKELDDSVLLESYLDAMAEELRQLKFSVYRESGLDSFLLLKSPAYIMNLAQAELEEYTIPFIDSKVYDDTLKYFRKFGLNAVNINCWFELTKLNSDSAAVVLFSTHSASDQVNGKFFRHPILFDVTYKYTMQRITSDEVVGLVTYSGKKDAGYLNDFLLNSELKRSLPNDYKMSTYWHYDRSKNTISPALEWKFSRIK